LDRRDRLRQHRGMTQSDPHDIQAPALSWLGRMQHHVMWQRMQQQAGLIAAHGAASEIVWSCEHDPVYTTGRRGIDNRRMAELPAPLIVTDRGGETTFHGPGQVMLYPVLSLRARHLGVRDYVCLLEQSCIDLLDVHDIKAGRRDGLPGVWVDRAKVAAIGLRVSQGVVWHGMALNVRIDPQWFAAINACGAGLGVCSMHDFIEPLPLAELANEWYALLCTRLAAVH